MNVRAIANSATSYINKNESVLLLFGVGQSNIKGIVTPIYSAPVEIIAQIQSFTSEELQHVNKVNETRIVRKFYMNADALVPPSGIVRQKNRTGDLIRRPDGTWWLITDVPEDFTASMWIACVGTLQTIMPDLTLQEWYASWVENNGYTI